MKTPNLSLKTDIPPHQIAHFFLNDPKLAMEGLPDNHLVTLHKYLRYEKADGEYYWGIYQDNKLVALFNFYFFSDITINLHFYLATNKRHYLKKFFNIISEGVQKEFPHIMKAYIFTPASCKHITRVIPKLGFKQEAILKDALTWRQSLTDLHIYCYTVK